MTPRFQQILPDLASYRRELVATGAPFPLQRVTFAADGLIGELPASPPSCHGWPWQIQTQPAKDRERAWPKITVVMPSYQQGQFLEEAIRSVLLQNYPNLEFILLDGGSRDASATVLERYKPWLSFARSAADRGQAHAINLGFSLASGDIYAWLNSDDCYLPGTLYAVAEAYRAGAEFIYGDQIEFDDATRTRQYQVAQVARARFTRFSGLVFQPATFWAASAHRPLWEEQYCALDYELWIRLLPRLRLRYLPLPLAVARQHGAAKSFDPRIQGRWAEDARRNGDAHARLYAPTLPNRCVALEYRVTQRIARSVRSAGVTRKLLALHQACGWEQSEP